MLEKWFLLPDTARFSIIGCFNMGLRYIIFVILGLVFSTTHYQIILLLAWTISSIIAFLALKYLVFQSQGNHIKEFLKSLLIWSLSYIINAFILNIFVENLLIKPFIAQALAILIIFVMNYFLFKHFAFKKEKKWWQKLFGNIF